MEADSLVGVQDGAFPEHALETTHTTNHISNFNLANSFFALVFDLFEELAFGGDDLFQGRFEVWFGGGIATEELAGGLAILAFVEHTVSIELTVASLVAWREVLIEKAISGGLSEECGGGSGV